MSSILIKGVIRNGRVEVEEPIDLPEGTEVVVTTEIPVPNDHGPVSGSETVSAQTGKERIQSFDFMTEDEQGDDPATVQEWIDDLRSIPPLFETPEQDAERHAWDVKIRLFNLEAVRKQFENGVP